MIRFFLRKKGCYDFGFGFSYIKCSLLKKNLNFFVDSCEFKDLIKMDLYRKTIYIFNGFLFSIRLIISSVDICSFGKNINNLSFDFIKKQNRFSIPVFCAKNTSLFYVLRKLLSFYCSGFIPKRISIKSNKKRVFLSDLPLPKNVFIPRFLREVNPVLLKRVK